jgi:hypothetical protein
MDTGTRTGIVYLADDGSDPVTAYRTSIRNIVSFLEASDAPLTQGLLSARPAAGTARHWYKPTDTGLESTIYYDDGSTWQAIGASAPTDGSAATPSLRTLGSGSTQAAAGNHTHAIGAITGTGDSVTKNVGTAAGTVAAGNHVHAGSVTALYAQKTVDSSRSSTTTLADDPELTLTLAASGTYTIRAAVTYNAPSAAGLKMNFNIGTGVTLKAWNVIGCNVSGAFTQGSNVTVGGGAVNTTDIATQNGTVNHGNSNVFYHDVIVATGSSGTYTFTLRWAQNNFSATSATVMYGSYLLAEKIA